MRRLRAARPSEAGFTILEVVIALTIFATMVPATLSVVASTTTATTQNRSRVVAASLASSQIEAVRSAGASAIPSPVSPRTVGNVPYTVSQTVSAVTSGGSTVTCLTSSLTGVLKLVTVQVTWPGMGSTRPVRSDTLLRSSDSGAVAVTVTGASGQPVPGLPVQLSNGASVATDGSGCAVFSPVPLGTYTATLNSSGYTGQANTQAVTSSAVTVSSTGVSKASMVYDVAMSLSYRFVTANSGSTVSAAQLAEVPDSLKTATIASTYATTTQALDTAVTPLFPTTYSVKAGPGASCTLASQDLSSRTPTQQTVNVPTADVQVSNFATLLAIGGIRAIYQGPATGSGAISCPVGTSVDVGTVFGLFGDHKVTLPLGAWKIQVPWNAFGSVPIPGLTVYCYPVTLTSSSTGTTVINFLTWLSTILLNLLNWADGGC
ncbi:hypothetical protein ACIB24_19630 [Spongisporangium articulatum]|uniref:Prepilin-type N-terminal cleavage/methylation domain-containing protein n=1 Tax=Spongisporangium articulatum TaxID=3362603 RepID=A0ABW8ATH4_9ACTN